MSKRPSDTLTKRMPPKKVVKRQNASPNLMNPKMDARLMRTEKKFVDTAGSFTTPAGGVFISGAGKLLNGIVLGPGSNQRIGRNVHLKSLIVRIKVPAGATGGPVRVLCVYDKQTNGLIPASGAVLTTSSSLAFGNLANSDRFITVIDEFITPGNSLAAYYHQMYRKINLPTFYSGIGGIIDDITTGSLGLNVASITTGTIVDFEARVRYTDQ